MVPCGPGTEKETCEFCDFFVLINNIIREVLKYAGIIAVLMLISGGVMLFFAGASSEIFLRAKGIITSTVIGLVIVLSAWITINTIFDRLNVIEMDGWTWYNISCSVE